MKSNSNWYLRKVVPDEMLPDFLLRRSAGNAKRTYIISILGLLFLALLWLLDYFRYQNGYFEGGSFYYFSFLHHFVYILFLVPLFIYQKNKKQIITSTYPQSKRLVDLTILILCITLIPSGIFALFERSSLIVYAIFILIFNLVFTFSHQWRLFISLTYFLVITVCIFYTDSDTPQKIALFIGVAGITFPAYTIATFQYNFVAKDFMNENLLKKQKAIIEEQRKKSDELLLNILPEDVAKELKETGTTHARKHEGVTILFTDFKNFSSISQEVSPEVLLKELDYCFRGFDQIILKYNLEKIKTIGDAYLCVGGLAADSKAQAINVINAAMEIQAFLENRKAEKKTKPVFEARLGIHTGDLVSGIVGTTKFAFDVWGESVNIASRIEGAGEVGKINISINTFELIEEHFNCAFRGKLPIKNLGEIEMYFVESRKMS